MSDLRRTLDRCASFSPEVREIGRRSLDLLFREGRAGAGVPLAHIVVTEDFACSLSKREGIRILIEEVRRTGSPGAFLDLYHHGAHHISDDEMFELLTLAAPTCTEAAEILEARLPGWRHPKT